MSNLTKRPPFQKGQKRRRVKSEAEREDAEFLDWIRMQPSCVSGRFSEYVNGQGRCVAAHVRRSNNSGTAHKPLFSAIPLSDAEHRLQHQLGEAGFLEATFGGAWNRHSAAAWFDEQVERYVSHWQGMKRTKEAVAQAWAGINGDRTKDDL